MSIPDLTLDPRAWRGALVSLTLAAVGCGGAGQEEGESPSPTPGMPPAAAEDWSRDLTETHLELDVSTGQGLAVVRLAPLAGDGGLSLEAGGLGILAVTDDSGAALDWTRDDADGSIDVGVPAQASELHVSYTFPTMGFTFDGYMASGDSFVWPSFCGNLFPCHSDPADGLRFSVNVTGLPEGSIAVAPSETISLDAPAYQLGFSVGPYTRHELGTTPAGTRVVFYSLPGDAEEDIAAGTGHFRDYVEELERWFGPYPYGPEVGAKSVLWCEEGGCEYAGMEEHPYFDVSDGSIYDPTVFAHEAAHAWFGDGVRLGCWGEDLVLSEGTATYLEIAIMGNVEGQAAADAGIAYYQDWLAYSKDVGEDAVVWPETCDEVDTYDIWYSVTYSRGALFWVEVEGEVGREALLGAFRDFTEEHLGGTASMGDLLDTVHLSTGFDPWPVAEAWLRSTEER